MTLSTLAGMIKRMNEIDERLEEISGYSEYSQTIYKNEVTKLGTEKYMLEEDFNRFLYNLTNDNGSLC